MDAAGTPELGQLSQSTTWYGRLIDYVVSFNALAAIGALVAAIAPAVMATADAVMDDDDGGVEVGTIVLRGSVSDYWDVDLAVALATVFFVLFALVMLYASLLGLTGRLRPGEPESETRQAEWVNGIVSLLFVALLGVALIFYWIGWVTFYFFELYALISFALHYVISGANPFPYNRYEFRVPWVNRLLRTLRIMRR